MGEPKPLASLSSSLLARKGQAKPAMRPQGFANFGFGGSNGHDDLGWNDMGHDHVTQDHGLSAAAAPVSAQVVPIVPVALVETAVERPAVVRQQEELAREMSPPPAAIARTPRAAAGSKGKAAFTLRLDPDRHLRLRLVCAVNHKSAQAIVVAALDAFLSTQPAVAALAQVASTTSGQG